MLINHIITKKFNKRKKKLYFHIFIAFKIIILILSFPILKYSFKENIFISIYNPQNRTKINISNYSINYILLQEKEKLLEYISKSIKKNITNIKSLFLDFECHFGNQLILLNKVIFYCEILGCKKIILNKKHYWFIKNKINYKKYKMSLQIGNINDYKKDGIIIDKSPNFFWYFNYIIPQFRSEILKKEILKNLPKIKTKSNDIYLYIRSGDIFEHYLKYYFQPPLCFYQNILNNFQFKNIYIIAENKKNPVIQNLLNIFPNIIFNKNSLKYDISYLAYAYNIVGAYSTFLFNIIRFNDNLKLYWNFEFTKDFFFLLILIIKILYYFK
jgi:hypothetical protein